MLNNWVSYYHHYISGTQKNTVELEKEIKDILRNVVDPVSQRNIISIGMVKSIRVNTEQTVSMELDLRVPGHPDEELIMEECRKKIEAVSWVRDLSVKSLKRKSRSLFAASGTSLSGVEHVIAVSSCKGGVGKSTVAVNIAFELARRGLRVGLLDADVYGPSLPYLVTADDPVVRKSSHNSKMVDPILQDGVSMLSFGHVNPAAGLPGAGGRDAAVLRGPQASRVINQLISSTNWGELDYLIVDMPPGTGDIQITLCQSVGFTGAVVVTTPHRLALQDVFKGIQMFSSLRVSVLALVENMAYFRCRHGEVHYPFGHGGDLKRKLQDTLPKGCPVHELPLVDDMDDDDVMANNVSGSQSQQIFRPVVLRDPGSETAKCFKGIASDLIRQ
eukprot:gene4095-8143_t